MISTLPKTDFVRISALISTFSLFFMLLLSTSAVAEVAMYGGTPSRNMVSDETGLPSSWDLKTGKNIKWKQALGSQSYGGPLVAGGKVFVGTNNETPRDPKITGDKGVVMVFNAEDGDLLYAVCRGRSHLLRIESSRADLCRHRSIHGRRERRANHR